MSGLLHFAFPLSIVVAFIIHWQTLIPVKSSSDRLEYSRGVYLGMSLQVLIMSGIYTLVLGEENVELYLMFAGLFFSSIGDFFNLQFPKIQNLMKEPIFGGILSFMVAQVCYLAAFFHREAWSVLLHTWHYKILLIAIPAVATLIFWKRVYNPAKLKRVMYSAALYGILLSVMVATALSYAFEFGGGWNVVGLGAIFFLISDAYMGETTLKGRHPSNEYQVPWFTYLIAQCLLFWGMIY